MVVVLGGECLGEKPSSVPGYGYDLALADVRDSRGSQGGMLLGELAPDSALLSRPGRNSRCPMRCGSQLAGGEGWKFEARKPVSSRCRLL